MIKNEFWRITIDIHRNNIQFFCFYDEKHKFVVHQKWELYISYKIKWNHIHRNEKYIQLKKSIQLKWKYLFDITSIRNASKYLLKYEWKNKCDNKWHDSSVLNMNLSIYKVMQMLHG